MRRSYQALFVAVGLLSFANVGLADEPCVRPPIRFDFVGRPTEAAQLSLTRCDGSVIEASRRALSVLAREAELAPPSASELANASSTHATATIPLLDLALVERLQAIASHWPDRSMTIVSAHRSDARPGSRHHSAKAIDIRVEGVPREDVVLFARTIERTGVGYYPNSTFTHIDVRDRSTYWVDLSSPGEPARYASALAVVAPTVTPSTTVAAATTSETPAPTPNARSNREARTTSTRSVVASSSRSIDWSPPW